MKVRVRLIGQFMVQAGYSERALDVPEGCTPGGLAVVLGLDAVDHVMTRAAHPLPTDEPLAEGDRVVVAPIFSGG